MAIILGNDLITNERTVRIEENNFIHFNGTEKELIQLIIDTHAMAEAILTDLDAGNFDENQEAMDIEMYREFSEKY
jgi:hypothetical protein